MNKLAICTVVYENYEVLQDFMRSLVKQTDVNFHLYIADTSKIPQKIEHPTLPLTHLPTENNGYSHGINVCLEQAQQDGFNKFCVINDDTYVEVNFVENILLSLEKHPASIIGGKIYYAPGYEFHKNRYTENQLGKIIWYAGGEIDWNHVTTSHTGVDEFDEGQFNTFQETGFVTGCLTCFDNKVIDTIGLWDTSYFLYYEDADFCVRAQKKGLYCYFDPSIVIWHKNAQSTDGSGSQLHTYYQHKNRMKFGLKYAPLKTKLHLLKNSFIEKTDTR